MFYAAGSRPHGALSQSKIWYYNLYLPLCYLGHEVLHFDYDLEPHYANANNLVLEQREFNKIEGPRLERELLCQVSEAHRRKPLDLFFSYFYSSFVRPEVIRRIRSMGIVTVNWYCNASYQFHLIKELAPAYDFCLVPEKFRLEDYRCIGATPIYCQEGANPRFYKPYILPREYDVTFIGAQYGERAEYVRYLLDKGIKVHVWGPGWTSLCVPERWEEQLRWWAQRVKRIAFGQRDRVLPILSRKYCGAPLTDEEMIRMYSRSKISLGFSIVGETHKSCQPIKQIRLRDFEAPMSGAFYMVEYMEELEEFFKPGEEIVCYYDKTDLADKIGYYLCHDKEREKIRQAGYARAVNEHTWQKRLERAFREMSLH